MGCNCGKKANGTKQSFVYTSPTGKQTTYSTEIEAKAAMIRGGGGDYKPA